MGFWFVNFMGADFFKQSCAWRAWEFRMENRWLQKTVPEVNTESTALAGYPRRAVSTWRSCVHLGILEELCPIDVGQFLLVQADMMPC